MSAAGSRWKSLSEYCIAQIQEFEQTRLLSESFSHESFWKQLNLSRVHPFCENVQDFSWDTDVPPMGPLLLLHPNQNSLDSFVTLWYRIAPPLLAMAELWLRLFAGIMAPIGCLYLANLIFVPSLYHSKHHHDKHYFHHHHHLTINNNMPLYHQHWKRISIACLLTVASSLVLMTDTYYVLENGPVPGVIVFVTAITLASVTCLRYKLPSILSIMIGIIVLWAFFLICDVMVEDGTFRWHFGDPSEQIINIKEGLYYNPENPFIQSVVDHWPEHYRTYSYAQGATPWMRTGDSRTGLPFLLHKAPTLTWHKAFLETLEDKDEYVGLHIAFPQSNSSYSRGTDHISAPPIGGGQAVQKAPKPLYLLLHGLNGGTDEGYIRDFAKRRTAEGSTVVVMIARGLMDYPIRGWNIFHGARTSDAHAAALALRKVLKPGQVLIGVGYSMGAIVLNNYVASYGADCALDGAIGISGGLDMRFQEHFHRAQRLWQPMLAETLRTQFLMGKWGQRVQARISKDDMTSMLRATHVTDIDRSAVVPYHGFRDLDHYYTSMSALGDIPLDDNGRPQLENTGKIHNVAIPFCVVHALDDPLVTWRATAQNEGFMHPSNLSRSGSGNVMILLTKAGGHVGWPLGWISSNDNWKWMSDVAMTFGEAVNSAQQSDSTYVLRGTADPTKGSPINSETSMPDFPQEDEL